MTRLTSDTAFKETFHQNISPIKLVTMAAMVDIIIREERKSNPKKMKVTTNIALIVMTRLIIVSCHIVRYCS